MRGCIINPDSGPATNTIAILDFDNPSDNKYGEAADIRIILSITAQTLTQCTDHMTFQHSRKSVLPANPLSRSGDVPMVDREYARRPSDERNFVRLLRQWKVKRTQSSSQCCDCCAFEVTGDIAALQQRLPFVIRVVTELTSPK